MAGYNRTEAYDLSLFEEQVVRQKVEPIGVKKEQRLPEPKRTRNPDAANEASGVSRAYALRLRSAIKAAAFAAASLACVALVLFSRAQSDELTREISSVEKNIKVAQSENVRLNTAMNSMVSMDKVDAYAEGVLGMVKAENYQITYIDMSKGDEIVLSGDKSAENEKLSSRLKALLAYLQ